MARMSRDDIYKALEGIFQREFDNPNIRLLPETTAADVPGWDSHRQIELILACEETLGIRLKPREINAMSNVAEMVDHLERAINR